VIDLESKALAVDNEVHNQELGSVWKKRWRLLDGALGSCPVGTKLAMNQYRRSFRIGDDLKELNDFLFFRMPWFHVNGLTRQFYQSDFISP
jgi:hypothetical protein